MKKINLKHTVISFFAGVIVTALGGYINWQIHRQNLDNEQKIQTEVNQEKFATLLSELNFEYDQLKNNLRKKLDCEDTYKNLNQIYSISIKLMGMPNVTMEQKMRLLDLNDKLNFITQNYCEILEKIAKKHAKPIGALVNGKYIEGFVFEGNLKQTDTIVAHFLAELIIK